MNVHGNNLNQAYAGSAIGISGPEKLPSITQRLGDLHQGLEKIAARLEAIDDRVSGGIQQAVQPNEARQGEPHLSIRVLNLLGALSRIESVVDRLESAIG